MNPPRQQARQRIAELFPTATPEQLDEASKRFRQYAEALLKIAAEHDKLSEWVPGYGPLPSRREQVSTDRGVDKSGGADVINKNGR